MISANKPFTNIPAARPSTAPQAARSVGFRRFRLSSSTVRIPTKPPKSPPAMIPSPHRKGASNAAPMRPPTMEAQNDLREAPNLTAPAIPTAKSASSARMERSSSVIRILKPILSNPVTAAYTAASIRMTKVPGRPNRMEKAPKKSTRMNRVSPPISTGLNVISFFSSWSV